MHAWDLFVAVGAAFCISRSVLVLLGASVTCNTN